MTRLAPLHPVRHARIKLRQRADAPKLRFALLGLSELPIASADFPICLAKEAETGRFNLIALFSLAEPRNLYWLNQQWQATYVPEATTTAPFRLDPNGQYGVAIDEDGVTLDADGMQLFAADGQPSELLKNISTRLKRVVADIADAQSMIDDFARRRLVRPLQLVLKHDDGTEHQIDGLYGLGANALAALDDNSVVELYRTGHLAAASIMSASLSQIERLRQLHNASSARRIASATATIPE